jgi:hypothetical protein
VRPPRVHGRARPARRRAHLVRLGSASRFRRTIPGARARTRRATSEPPPP